MQKPAAMPGKIHQVSRGCQHILGAADDFAADIRQHHVARASFHHGDAQYPLEIADLHGERRLGHRAGFRRPAEVPVGGKRGEVFQLSKRDHQHQIN